MPETKASGTLLIVEDEDDVRSMIANHLRHEGYQVLEAASGPQAFSLATSHTGTIQLLLVDVLLPGMKGPEIAAGIAKERPGVKVLMMTGYDTKVLASLGVSSVDPCLLIKPFGLENLSRRVRQMLEPAADPSSGSTP